MIHYRGYRDTEGVGHQLVTKDYDLLDPAPSLTIWNHSPDGFSWGFQGSGPAQLALALLYDVTGNKDIAVLFHQKFKRALVSTWGDTWEITDDYIQGWVDGKIGSIEESLDRDSKEK